MPGNNYDVIARMELKKERLIQYLKRKDGETDPAMEDMWNMFMWIEDKLRAMSRKNVVNATAKKYSISKTWAYRLVNETMSFSGQAHKPDSEYLRQVQIESLQMDIKLARASGELKVLPSLYKELRLWLFPKGETDIDMEKLELHQFNIQVSLNGDTASLPLETFYNLKEAERVALEASTDDGHVSWDLIKEQIDGPKET